MSKIEKIFSNLLHEKNTSSALKYEFELFEEGNLDIFSELGDEDEIDDALNKRYAVYFNEFGDFFIGFWQPDKKIKENQMKYESTGDISVFAEVFGKSFENYKGINISPKIEFQDVVKLTVNIHNTNEFVISRDKTNSMLFGESNPFSLKLGAFSNVLKLSNLVLKKFEFSKKTKNEIKLSRQHSIKITIESLVVNPQKFSFDFVDTQNAVNFLNCLAQVELRTNNSSLERNKNIISSIQPQLNDVQSIFRSLEEKSIFPALDQEQLNIHREFYISNGYDTEYFTKQYKQIISSRKATLDSTSMILHPEIAQYFTIIETDKILLENGMNDYGLYEVTRSNHPQITKGIHFYSFDDADNLLVLGAPYQVLSANHSQYIVFDSRLYDTNKLVRIPKYEILSFKLYGTELMQSTVSTNTRPSEVTVLENQPSEKYQRPSITGTFFSALLFGSTYTLLNGVGKSLHNQTNVLGNKLDSLGGQLDRVVEAINNISITTDHKIIDTSRVQIVLSNRRDLEIDGINIFYDLNRVYPNLDKPSNDSVPKLEEKAPSSTNMADEVLKLKQLLDQGIIDEEEFKAMKKKLIN